MGIIYLAEDREHDNAPCVVKQLISKPSSQDEQSEAVRLFEREANLLREFNHRGIVHFFDYHTTLDGKYFLVMDYVPGKNLDSIVNTYGPFNSEATVEIAIQICEVLEYLHERNPPIIYRDLKPSNLMLTPDGNIIFIDFGIARSFMPKESATRVVTAGYSPPEQYFGKPETRSDLYSLGATMGHLLTGQRPKPLTMIAPRLLGAEVVLSLDDLVRRLTSHSPEDRPPSAREVKYELYRIYHEIHPDFQIPEEAVLTKQRGTSAALSGRKGAIASALSAEMLDSATADHESLQKITQVQIERLKEENKHKRTGTNMRGVEDPNSKRTGGIWSRLKQWFNMNFNS